jgi:uncharacterized linocin/CFP29 family protein
MFESFRSAGVPLDTEGMRSAMQRVIDQEEALLLQGWAPDGTNYEVKGLYQGAGTTEATSSDFATFGNATTEITLVMAALAALEITNQNYHLVLNPTQYQQARASRSTTYGVPEWPDLPGILNPNPAMPAGSIWQSNRITAGTGLFVPVDPEGLYYDLLVGHEARNVLGYDSRLGEDSPIFGHVVECMRPRIKQSTALVKATGI